MIFALLLTVLAGVYMIARHEEPVPEKVSEEKESLYKRRIR